MTSLSFPRLIKYDAPHADYSPSDYWWWQQLTELQKQAAERKRFEKRLNYICIAWAAVTAAGICFAVVVTKLYAK